MNCMNMQLVIVEMICKTNLRTTIPERDDQD